MKWFDRWFAKKCKWAWENKDEESSYPSTRGAINEPIGSNRISSMNGMNFTVYRASGGHIVEYSSYDRKLDRNNHNLHIINDDKDLGEELGKIITIENLRS